MGSDPRSKNRSERSCTRVDPTFPDQFIVNGRPGGLAGRTTLDTLFKLIHGRTHKVFRSIANGRLFFFFFFLNGRRETPSPIQDQPDFTSTSEEEKAPLLPSVSLLWISPLLGMIGLKTVSSNSPYNLLLLPSSSPSLFLLLPSHHFLGQACPLLDASSKSSLRVKSPLGIPFSPLYSSALSGLHS